MVVRLGIAVVMLSATSMVAAEVPVPAPPPAIAFVDVNVVPMDRERVLKGQTVLVENGMIRAIGSKVKLPKGVRVIDGQGKAWLSPGLADMHNHVDTRQDLAVQLASGVTTMLNMGEARNSFVGRTRAAVARGDVPGPRAFVALAVDGSPQYGHLVVSNDDEARATVAVAKANGYDYLKVYNNLAPAVFDALVREAKAAGIAVVGHGVTQVGLAKQIEAGQALVAHAEEFLYTFFPLPPENDPNAAPTDAEIARAVAFLKAHDVFVAADLVTYRTIAEQWGRPDVVQGMLARPEARWLAPQFRVAWAQAGYAKRTGSLDARVAFLGRFIGAMNAAGIPLLSGTDSPDIPGLVPGNALHRNLALLLDVGLSRYEALATATRRAGEFVARTKPGEAPFGTVAVGSRADLILSDANPLDNLWTLATPRGVMANGRWYDAAALAALLQGVTDSYVAAMAPAAVNIDVAACLARDSNAVLVPAEAHAATLSLPAGSSGPYGELDTSSLRWQTAIGDVWVKFYDDPEGIPGIEKLPDVPGSPMFYRWRTWSDVDVLVGFLPKAAGRDRGMSVQVPVDWNACSSISRAAAIARSARPINDPAKLKLEKIDGEGTDLVATVVNETGRAKQVRRGDEVTRDGGAVESISRDGIAIKEYDWSRGWRRVKLTLPEAQAPTCAPSASCGPPSESRNEPANGEHDGTR